MPDVAESYVDEGSWTATSQNSETRAQVSEDPSVERQARSTIKFPYSDLKEAARIPATIKNNFGSGCDLDQLAGQFRQPVGSGAFRTRIAAASMFGLVNSKKSRVTVTALGHEVAGGSRRAIVAAFLNIELYKAIYDLYRGTTLPADPGLSGQIQQLGVVENQADRARQVMQRSAEYAGMFESGRDRLVIPPTASTDEADATNDEDDHPSSVVSPAPRPIATMADNPLLMGLWSMLPTEGDFPAERRAQWFRALAINLDLVYGDVQLEVQLRRTGSDETATQPRFRQ